jgi:hypothetical protein
VYCRARPATEDLSRVNTRRLLAITAVTATAVLMPVSVTLAFWDAPVTDLSPPDGEANRPVVAAGADGSATAVWQRQLAPDEHRIEARRFAGGTWEPLTVLATAPEGGVAEDAEVASGPAGTAFAVWAIRSDDVTGVFASRYAAGEWSTPFPLSAPGIAAEQPQVAVDDAGVATVAWTLMGGAQPVIQARRFVNGTWQGTDDLSDATRAASQSRVVVDGNGVVTVAWVRDNAGDGKLAVQARRYNGASWGAPADLSEAATGADNPQLVVDPAGVVTAVWAKVIPDPGSGPDISIVQARRFSGGAWSPRVDLSPAGAGAFGHRVAVDASGVATAVWLRFTAPDQGVVQAVRNPGGTWSAPQDLSGPPSSVFWPAVTARGAGAATALWTQNTGSGPVVTAARFSAGAWGGPVPVSSGETMPGELRAATDPTGAVTAVWISGALDARRVRASRVALPVEPTSPGPAPVAPAPVAPSAAAPGAPTLVSAQAGLRSALVRWTPPASDGGATITSYLVRALPGGRTCRWSGGPTTCRVTGLANTRAFRFTVTAENAGGAGAASTPSAAVRPWAPLRVARPRVGPLAIDVLVRAPGAGSAVARGTARIGRRADAPTCSGAARTRARGAAISLPVRCTLTAGVRRQRARGPVRVNLTITHTTTRGALFRADRVVTLARG